MDELLLPRKRSVEVWQDPRRKRRNGSVEVDQVFFVNGIVVSQGRASASPAMDVFITLLSLGVNGYKNLISQRKEMYKYLKEELGKVATKHGERLLDTKNNPISIAMTLTSLASGDSKRVSMLGSMLFLRSVSGTRVISGTELKEVAGYKFEDNQFTWGRTSAKKHVESGGPQTSSPVTTLAQDPVSPIQRATWVSLREGNKIKGDWDVIKRSRA
ncbi:hypothetical protein J6590_015949 [Homalodisca vitripennis]|nr:hypothetical protein J6590_015949 [Homalodisca vitripennis]